MDVTTRDAMATLCRGIHDRWGKLDLWCHTAIHAASLSPATMTDAKEFQTSLDVNVTATATLVTFVAPLLGSVGRAVFFDDPRAGEKFFGVYGATKAAQIALARSWAAETARNSPQVDILQPPPMPTSVRGRFFPGEDRTALTDPDTAAAALLSRIAAS
jgi:NAD(P)-dependent dehydrogenase (short-subunit alcohol dehydrogenase family)